MKKRRTKPTLRAQREIIARNWKAMCRAQRESFEDWRGDRNALDAHVRDYRSAIDICESWQATNRTHSNYPGGECVDIPWMTFWRKHEDLYHDDYDHELWDKGWLDDAFYAKRRLGWIATLRKQGRHKDEIHSYRGSLLDEVRARMEPSVIAIGRYQHGPYQDFERVRRQLPCVPIDGLHIRFVLPDDHEAVMFKLRWGA